MKLLNYFLLLFCLVQFSSCKKPGAVAENSSEVSDFGTNAMDDSCVSPDFQICVNGNKPNCGRFCPAKCKDAVNQCVSGFGGLSCRDKCKKVAGPNDCTYAQEYRNFPSTECAIPFAGVSDNTTTPGEATGLCRKKTCNGLTSFDQCNPLRGPGGRPKCSIGVWVDANGNPK